jgi:hypothetical protein
VNTANAIGLHSRLTRAADLVSADLDGEIALMSVAAGKYYGLEPVGSRIWALLETSRSVSEICTVLVAEFEVEREQCEREVLAFLNLMAQANLIKVVNEPTA